MKTRFLFFAFMLVLMMAVSACNFPLVRAREDEAEALATFVAQTVEAMATSASIPALPTPQAGKPLPPAAVTPDGTATVPPAATATPLPCNRARFIGETIPDDTEFDAGKTFTKSWTLRNEGTCTWNTQYRLVFESGDAMGGPASVSLTRSVAPNEQVTIEVPQIAPANPGTYTGFWRMQAENNERFSQVFVRIKVKEPFFAVTSVRTNLQNVDASSCPYTYPVEISIITSASGEVIFKTENSLDETSAIQSVTLDSAGTRVVNLNWSGLGGLPGSTTSYWLRVYIDDPNNQWFGPYNFNVTCPS